MSHADRIARPDWRHRRAAARMRALRQREREGRVIVAVKAESTPNVSLTPNCSRAGAFG
jgi:hypothetical protein